MFRKLMHVPWRHYQRTIAIEMHGGNGIGVGGKIFQLRSRFDIPNSDTFIETARNNQIWLGIKTTTQNIIRMALVFF